MIILLLAFAMLPMSLMAGHVSAKPESPVWQTKIVLVETPDMIALPVREVVIEKTQSRYKEEQIRLEQEKLEAERKAQEAAKAAEEAEKAKQAQAQASAQIASTSCDPNMSGDEKASVLKSAADAYGIPVQLLQAVHFVESGGKVCTPENYGSSAGARGPFQFMPGTWRGYAVDGNGDGIKNINDIRDAAYGAARLLAANGAADGDLQRALFAYNHAQWYVNKVLNIAGL